MPSNPLFQYFFLLILLASSAFGCTLCKSEIPTLHTAIKAQLDTKIKTFDIYWKFNKTFCDETLQLYDTNQNKRLDEEELKAVQKSLEDYLKAHQHLTYLYSVASDTNHSFAMIDFNVTHEKIAYLHGVIVYQFQIQTQANFQANKQYTLEFLDERMLFNFAVQDFKSDTTLEITQTQNAVSFTQSTTPIATQNTKPTQTQPQSNALIVQLTQHLAALKKDIQQTLQTIAIQNSLASYLWLLAFSFIYGVLHAMGPGHGKSLVASYFLGNNASIFKAFSIAGMIGVVHTFAAFIFSFVVYYIIKGLLSTYFGDVERIATQISAVIIIAIALYLFYQKQRKTKTSHFRIAPKRNSLTLQPHKTPNPAQSCACSSCNTASTDMGVILAAGIIPCPGTVTIFIFAFSLGIFEIGFLSAIFMSLGMSLVIFLTAYLTIKFKLYAIENSKAKVALEYLSLLFILGLGLGLLLV